MASQQVGDIGMATKQSCDQQLYRSFTQDPGKLKYVAQDPEGRKTPQNLNLATRQRKN